MLSLETSLDLLVIANLIASREINCCEADLELSRGNWLSDHTKTDKWLDDEITQKIKAIRQMLNTEAKPELPSCPFCKCDHLRTEEESEG